MWTELTVERKLDSNNSMRILRTPCICQTVIYVGTGSLSGCYCHLWEHNLLSHTTYICWMHGWENGGPLTLTTFCFFWLNGIWRLGGWTDNCCELQNGPLWFLYWYQSPSPDSWLVNSTCYPKAKEDVCCQSGSSHVETPGRSYSAGRHEVKYRRGGLAGGCWGWGGCYSRHFYATVLQLKYVPLRKNNTAIQTKCQSQLAMRFKSTIT